MKSALLVVLLAAVASAAVFDNDVSDVADDVNKVIVTEVDELTDEAEVPVLIAGRNRLTLNLGDIGPRDVLASDERFTFDRAIDVSARFLGRITAIRVNPWRNSYSANPTLMSGGIDFNFATIRLTPTRGQGFDYRIQFYVR